MKYYECTDLFEESNSYNYSIIKEQYERTYYENNC